MTEAFSKFHQACAAERSASGRHGAMTVILGYWDYDELQGELRATLNDADWHSTLKDDCDVMIVAGCRVYRSYSNKHGLLAAISESPV